MLSSPSPDDLYFLHKSKYSFILFTWLVLISICTSGLYDNIGEEFPKAGIEISLFLVLI